LFPRLVKALLQAQPTLDRLGTGEGRITIAFHQSPLEHILTPGASACRNFSSQDEGVVVAFWWVNHKRSWKPETSRGALWSPLTKSNGAQYRAYSNMTLARTGDVVFSFAKGKIGHVGVVEGEATTEDKPSYASDAPWAKNGWMLPVTFVALTPPIDPREHLDVVERYRPKSHSPIQANGHGTLNYLSAISDEFGNALLKITSLDLDQLTASATRDDVLDDIKAIEKDPSTSPTVRLQLSNARIGQGAFRKRVLAMEPACRVTGIAIPSLLRAPRWCQWTDARPSY
jgi:hypothetical protein